jgi:hypothetical protein
MGTCGKPEESWIRPKPGGRREKAIQLMDEAMKKEVQQDEAYDQERRR